MYKKQWFMRKYTVNTVRPYADRPYTVDTVTLKGPYRTYVSYRMGASYG